MAPTSTKRISDILEDDASSSNFSQSDGDSFSSRARKRRRTTEDALVYQNSPENGQSNDGTPPTPSSLASGEEDEYEHAATQALQERNAGDRNNIPAECGVLEEVHVRDFMCHDNFVFPMGPLINFICGKNGSGKSAVLTALTLCLGGKASATNRGQSLKNFIKEGAETAVITVNIKNHGEGAYLPDEYGRTIQVERFFSRSGSSGFKIKSDKGRVISTRKADLEDICDHFALQIDNPMNVLTQDMARQFLGGASPADKYKFFVKGVQLEQLDQDYRLIEDNVDNIEAKIDAKRPDIKVLKTKMLRAKEKVELSDRHGGIRDKLHNYRRQIAWIQVQHQEELRDEYITELEEIDAKIQEAEHRAADLGDVYEAADAASTEAMASVQEAENQTNLAQDEKKEAKAIHDEIKRETQEAQSEQRNIHSALKEAERKIATKKREIETERQRLAEIDGGGAAVRLAALDEAKDAVKVAYDRLMDHRNQREPLEHAIRDAEATQTATDQARNGKTADAALQRQRLETISRERNDQDKHFPPHMPALLKAIQNERSFTERPVGPIGKHVRLLKPQWSSILERSFGATLNSFIVTSQRDMNILNGLMNKVQCKCQILISNTQPINTLPHEPSLEFETTLRVLDIDNDLVRKQLVIQHGIEQTILVEDMDEATRVLYGNSKPRNVKRCYCKNPSNRRLGIFLSYTRSGEPSQDPVDDWQGGSRMRTDGEAQIRIQEEVLQAANQQLRRASDDCRAAAATLVKARQAAERHKRQERDLQVEHQKAEDEVDRLNEAIGEDNIEGGKLEVLQAALIEAENAKALHEGSYQDSVIALDSHKETLNAERAKLSAIDDRISKLTLAAQAKAAHAAALTKKRAYALGEKNNAYARIEDANRDKATLQLRLSEKLSHIERISEQATVLSPRVNIDAGETEDSLRKKYERMTKELIGYERQIGGTREQIAADAASTKEAYDQGVDQLRGLENLAGSLKKSLMERRERWRKFRSFISCRAKAQFTYLLSERSFRGKLVTDHKRKLLDLHVEPDITKRDGSGRSARTLSGGEKSFSQICLLLSIWEAMGSPIRCLDEFDVFMDAVNRKMSMDMLVGAARQSVGRQFLLISPGTKADITLAPDIHVKDLGEPLRSGQTRLVF